VHKNIIYLNISLVLLGISCSGENAPQVSPVGATPAQQQAQAPGFVIRDFGGGGNCFFLSLAGILTQLDGTARTQEWIRNEMAHFLTTTAPVADRTRWGDTLHDLQHDPLLAAHYRNVHTIEDLAHRIQNAAPFTGVYEGDELSIEIAEMTFDITLGMIDRIDPIVDNNQFKNPPLNNRMNNRFALMRHAGGDAGGHFQVYAYGADLGYNLGHPNAIPDAVKHLINRYATQYHVAFRLP
jgi:hypothetical protein